MWEKLNKILIQNIIAVITIGGGLAVVIAALFVKIPLDNMQLINKFFDVTLFGVIGWLFTQSKNRPQ